MRRFIPKKVEEIAEFLIDEGICEIYGEMSAEDAAKSLGIPTIDLDRELISYTEHTFDDVHVIELEYDGEFEAFMYMSVDG